MFLNVLKQSMTFSPYLSVNQSSPVLSVPRTVFPNLYRMSPLSLPSNPTSRRTCSWLQTIMFPPCFLPTHLYLLFSFAVSSTVSLECNEREPALCYRISSVKHQAYQKNNNCRMQTICHTIVKMKPIVPLIFGLFLHILQSFNAEGNRLQA